MGRMGGGGGDEEEEVGLGGVTVEEDEETGEEEIEGSRTVDRQQEMVDVQQARSRQGMIDGGLDDSLVDGPIRRTRMVRGQKHRGQ